VTATPARTFIVAPPTLTFTPAPRFVDNGNGTITDNQTGLMWEKKDRSGGLHPSATRYTWSGLCGCATGACSGTEPSCQPNAAAAGACSAATGSVGCSLCSAGACNVDPFGHGVSTTIWDWLVQLNASTFAGHADWRIPTVGQGGGPAQLETILAAPYPCGASPCVPAVFNTGCAAGCSVTGCSCTAPGNHWSAMTCAAVPRLAWHVYFGNGLVDRSDKTYGLSVRAVR